MSTLTAKLDTLPDYEARILREHTTRVRVALTELVEAMEHGVGPALMAELHADVADAYHGRLWIGRRIGDETLVSGDLKRERHHRAEAAAYTRDAEEV